MTDTQALRRLLTYALAEAKSLEQDEVANLLASALDALSLKVGGTCDHGSDDDVLSAGRTSGYLQ